jgi:hypothetical protein
VFVSVRVKHHSDTRWSAKAAAWNAVSRQLEKVTAALEELRDIATEALDTRQDATVIVNGADKFEFVTLLFFWSEILSSIDRIERCVSH